MGERGSEALLSQPDYAVGGTSRVLRWSSGEVTDPVVRKDIEEVTQDPAEWE